MKIKQLQKNIIQNAVITVTLLGIFIVISNYVTKQKHENSETLKQITNETNEITASISELEIQLKDAAKYKEIWKTISSNKKNYKQQVKADQINSFIQDLSEKHGILKPAIQLNVPQELTNGIFKLKTLDSFKANGSIVFDAPDDIAAIAFINDFFNKLPGYVITTSFEIKKNKKYTEADLVALSSKSISGTISVKVDFMWFSYREKIDSANQGPITPDMI